MSNTGNMAFVTSGLESIKDAIEKYKKARTELSYRDIWETFKNLMDYIEFFDMGTPRRLLKKSANEWLGTNHELSWKSDKIKREHVRELKRIFQILLNHQALEVLGTVNVVVDEVCGEGTWAKYTIRFDNGASNSMFWETFEKLDLDAGDATWLHQSCCCDHCVNHLGIDLCDW